MAVGGRVVPNSRMSGRTVNETQDKAVAIGPRIVASGGFDALYREGMTLIEDVAAYLDGDGRSESRGLARDASFVYATESMRLTTRLMQLASWLLLQRAVNEGEITPLMAGRVYPVNVIVPLMLRLLRSNAW